MHEFLVVNLAAPVGCWVMTPANVPPSLRGRRFRERRPGVILCFWDALNHICLSRRACEASQAEPKSRPALTLTLPNGPLVRFDGCLKAYPSYCWQQQCGLIKIQTLIQNPDSDNNGSTLQQQVLFGLRRTRRRRFPTEVQTWLSRSREQVRRRGERGTPGPTGSRGNVLPKTVLAKRMQPKRGHALTRHN